MTKYRFNQRGDTIVEVLIALAIMSLVLAGAYATVDRNIKSSQQAQEHSRALEVAGSQLEQLKSYISAGNSVNSSSFCMYNGAPDTNPAHCKVDDNTGDQRYTVLMTKTVVGADTTFKSSVTWAGIHGGTDQIDLLYKAF